MIGEPLTQPMSFDELLFRWSSTNIHCDRERSGLTVSENGEDVQILHWTSPCPLKVLSVPSLERLDDYLPDADAAAIREQFQEQNAAL